MPRRSLCPRSTLSNTGDTKALNHGTTLATLPCERWPCARAWPAGLRCAATRTVGPSDDNVDDLASRVLVLNLAARGDGLAEWLTGADRYGTPFQVTLHQLDAHPIRLSSGPDIRLRESGRAPAGLRGTRPRVPSAHLR